MVNLWRVKEVVQRKTLRRKRQVATDACHSIPLPWFVLWRRNQRREIKNGILNTSLNFYKSLLKKKRLYKTMFNFEYTGIFNKNWTFLESYYSATKYHMNNFQVVHPRCVCQIIQYVFIVSRTLYINIISSTFIRTIY